MIYVKFAISIRLHINELILVHFFLQRVKWVEGGALAFFMKS